MEKGYHISNRFNVCEDVNARMPVIALAEEKTIPSKQLQTLIEFKYCIVEKKKHLLSKCLVEGETVKVWATASCYRNSGYVDEKRREAGATTDMEFYGNLIYDTMLIYYEIIKEEPHQKFSTSWTEYGIASVELSDIERISKVIDELIETERKNGFVPPVKCMICEGVEGIAFEWETKRPLEKGNKRIMCLDCLFDNADKRTVKKHAKESTNINNNE